MQVLVYLIIYLLLVFPLQAEKVPAGYVAKWDTIPLIKEDYTIKYDQDCVSFEGILKKGKIEQPHITPFKIVNKTLNNFINGYIIKAPDENTKELIINTVVIWPNYEQSDWYVLLGSNSCFVKWLEIQPDNIDSIIDLGKKN